MESGGRRCPLLLSEPDDFYEAPVRWTVLMLSDGCRSSDARHAGTLLIGTADHLRPGISECIFALYLSLSPPGSPPGVVADENPILPRPLRNHAVWPFRTACLRVGKCRAIERSGLSSTQKS